MGKPSSKSGASAWRRTLAERVRLYGHRNWIVVADSAYPAQCKPGVETVASDAGQVETLEAALAEIEAQGHVRPLVFVDAELSKLDEADAPGIGSYRSLLAKALAGKASSEIPHEEAIKALDKAAESFKVLIVKTDMKLPYTTVFLQLDCGYWSEAAEKRLRVKT